MDLAPYVDKEVMVQFAPGFGFILPLGMKGHVAPALIGDVNKGREPLQIPFLVGTVRNRSGRHVVEFKNGLPEQDREIFDLEVSPNVIVAVTLLQDKPMLTVVGARLS